MSTRKRNTEKGVIIFYTPCPASLLISEECVADVREPVERRRRSPSQPVNCVRALKRDEASPAGSQRDSRRDGPRSQPSLGRLQAKIEAESQEVEQMVRPLREAENGLVKDVERILSRRDVAEVRRRELLHKRWTERVWFPLQSRVEAHVSICAPGQVKRRQNLYAQYLHHCNTKGFVFLDTYDPREYNPFLPDSKKPHNFKVSSAQLKEPLCRQLHDRLKERRAARSCGAGSEYTLLWSNGPGSETVASQAGLVPLASSNFSPPASAEDEADGGRTGRLDSVPYHIRATATPCGRCRRPSCWFSRCGAGRRAESSHHQPE